MDHDSPISASARAKIRIRIKGVDYRMADQTAADIITSVVGTGARISGPFPLPSQVEEPRTALRDEIRSHRRLIEIIGSNQKTVDAFRRHNVPAGVEIAIVAPDEPAAADPAAPPAKRNRRHDSRVAAMQFLCSWEVQRHADMVTGLFDFFSERPQPRESTPSPKSSSKASSATSPSSTRSSASTPRTGPSATSRASTSPSCASPSSSSCAARTSRRW
jgi:small subunit ribosomal protein S10